jgi:hypothetical protein
MYLDITYIEETRIAVKLARDENGNHFVIIRNTRDTDIIPVGQDPDQAWADYQRIIARFKYQNYIF